jgi:hypothetical protein
MSPGAKRRPKAFVFDKKPPFDETQASGFSDHFPIELVIDTVP